MKKSSNTTSGKKTTPNNSKPSTTSSTSKNRPISDPGPQVKKVSSNRKQNDTSGRLVSTPQISNQVNPPRSSNSTSSNQSFYLSRGLHNTDDGPSALNPSEERGRPIVVPQQVPLPIPVQQRSYYSQPVLVAPQEAYRPHSLPPYPYPVYPSPIPPYPYAPYSIPYPPYNYDPYAYAPMYGDAYRGVSEYKLAIQQSLEESALDEKLRIADEEALRKAMQLSLDEQDEQGPYFDKADQEALQSALIRSVYDKGGREVPAAINVLTSDDQDEELQRKLAIEKANESALSSGMIRSIYDVKNESSDSGAAVALSSSHEINYPTPDENNTTTDTTKTLKSRRSFTQFKPAFIRSSDEEKSSIFK